MEITPATFEAVDRFNESLATTSRRMSVRGCHGLLPHSDINFPITVIDDTISIQVYSLEAVSRSGILFQINGDFISLKQPHACGRECYVVVYTDGDVEQDINDVPFAKPRFQYDYSQLEDISSDCLPIAKLSLSGEFWNIQELYIPPCMTVGSHPELFKIVQESVTHTKSILGKYSGNIEVANLMTIKMLCIELESYDGSETPKEFYVLLRKIAVALSSSIGNNVTLPDIPQFNNDDILLSISVMTNYLVAVDTSAVVPEPMPAPQRTKPTFEGVVWDAETR